AEAKYTVALEGLKIEDYNYGEDEATWNEAMALRQGTGEQLEKSDLQVPALKERAPELTKMEAEADRLYGVFAQTVGLLPGILAEAKTEFEKLQAAYADFNAALKPFDDRLSKNLDDSLALGYYQPQARDYYRQISAADRMSRDGAAFYAAALHGLYENDTTKLDEAANDLSALLKTATDFSGGLNDNQAKAELSKVIETINACRAVTLALRENVDKIVANNENRGEARDAVLGAIDNISKILNKVTSDFTDETIASTDLAWLTIILGILVALVLGLGIAFLFSSALTKALLDIVEHLSKGSDEVERAAMELSEASNTVASGTSENAASLEQTSSAIEELSSMTARNSENAVEAQKLIVEAGRAVDNSEQSMDKVIKAMDQIAYSGNEIGKIIKTIDDIAFQTNLLALNAAVEAARAGESGAGFAVVADEVRNLAIRSADAAKNTAGLIDKTIENIGTGSSLVKHTYEAFEILVGDFKKVSEIIDGVTAASTEQTQGISQITTAIQKMDQVTQTTASVSEETAGAANSLTDEAKHLDVYATKLLVLVKGSGRDKNGPRPIANKNGSGKPAKKAPAPWEELPM
ncbi:MAG: methyl-accepting chemotaxis protein, partial [Deltaproteobacteria bacterium]|nr:methyl-accepting chemotaxis protein [Deltaproteobacteria bacterium]